MNLAPGGFLRKWLHSLDIKDIGEIALNGLLMYAGWRLAPKDKGLGVQVLALVPGPLALKLAQTDGDSGFQLSVLGTGVSLPVNSQIVGLTMLAGLGLASLPWDVVGDTINKGFQAYNDAQDLVRKCEEFRDMYLIPRGGTQAEIDELNRLIGLVKRTGALHISEAVSPEYQAKVADLQAYYDYLVGKYESGGGAR